MMASFDEDRLRFKSFNNQPDTLAFALGKGPFTDVGVTERMVKTVYKDHITEQKRASADASLGFCIRG